MQTPYKILQLKQKQKKKLTSDLQRQRSFSVRYTKNGDHLSQCFIQKEMFANDKKLNSRQKSHQSAQLNNKKQTSGKKYEIIFRESIRKTNALRVKLYHPKGINKKQNILKFITLNQSFQMPFTTISQAKTRQIKSTQSKQKDKLHYSPKENFDHVRVDKYRIVLKQNPYIQVIPQISVQKCKLNTNQDKNKLSLDSNQNNQALDHDKDMQKVNRKQSIDSCFTENDWAETQKRKTTNFNWFDNQTQSTKINYHTKKSLKNDFKNKQSRYQSKLQDIQTIDCKNVANFIKIKKKRKLPISMMKESKNNQDFFQFKRTSTDDTINNSRRKSVTLNLEQRYFSPNKSSRFGTRIKFNSIEENFSGWQFGPCQTSHINEQQISLKSPFNLY